MNKLKKNIIIAKRKYRRRIPAILLLFLLPVFAAGQPIRDEILHKFDSTLSKYAGSIRNRAVVAGLYYQGTDTILPYGRINMMGRKASEDDLFQIASISKAFTGYLFCQQIAAGAIGANDPASKYLTIRNKAKYDSVTLVQLATHTSGLPTNTLVLLGPPILSYAAVSTAINQLVLIPVNAPELVVSLPWKIAVLPWPIPFFSTYGARSLSFDLNNARLRSQCRFRYSNIGMGLLGKILAENAGTDYEALLQAGICEVVGMENTSTIPTKAQKKKYATPHNTLGIRTLRTKFKEKGIEGAGGIRSTPRDMMKFLRLQLDSLQFPEAHQIARMGHQSYFVSKSEKRKGLELGLGWIKYVSGIPGQGTIIWHNGVLTGSSAFIGFIPEKKIGVFLLSNSRRGKRITKMGFRLLRAMEKKA